MHNKDSEITVFDYYAGLAMQNAVTEIQETVPASFWDTIKIVLIQVCHMYWLTVKYKEIPGVREQIAETSYKMADAMMKEREKYMSPNLIGGFAYSTEISS